MTYENFLNFLDEFEEIKSFAGKIKYADQNLQRIGSGSGRVVYDIDGEKVFKIAKNTKGVAQNEAEESAARYKDYDDILTNVYESANDDSWIIAEKAKKVNEKRIKELTGILSLNDLHMYLRNFDSQNHGGRKIFGLDANIEDELNNNEFVQRLINFSTDYSQHTGDYGRPSTYGEVMREGSPSIVLTDYGLNDEVYDTYYNPQRKQKYQLYELFDCADGNDDILSDIGNVGDDQRHGMWAIMPYSVSDGTGVINEDFISFVLNRKKYPTRPLPSTPYVIDQFHECVNNLKETLNHVTEKKKFYNNLLALQEYLLSQHGYDRDLLTKEEYEINETEILKKSGLSSESSKLLTPEYAQELADATVKKLNLNAPKMLGKGAFGFAFELDDNQILKITTDVSEADSATKLMRTHPKYIADVFNLYKIVDTENNNAPFYGIIEENIINKPLNEFLRYDNVISKILPNNMYFGDILHILIKPKKYDYNLIIDTAKKILTDKPEANISQADRTGAYKYIIGLLNIRNELVNLDIKSYDYIEPKNLGYKDGVLKYFDVGGYVAVEPYFSEENIVYLPEDGSSRYSFTDAVGQDNFPAYNQNDSSPVADNNIPPTDEDLEYHHVDDATKDKYIMDGRIKTFAPGSKSVEVKKKCRIGGLPDGTSVACNQGDINNLELNTIKEERKKSYMPGAQAVTVKKKCRLGGLPDGTSAQCNKGDIKNLNLKKINEEISGNKFYRAVEKYMGKTIEFEPEGYYEAIDNEGNPVFKYDTFWVSDVPEVAASKSIGGAVMGLYSMFMQHKKNPNIFYVYEINEKPDVDISHWDMCDFALLREVRYRRAIKGKYVGKVTITDDMKKRLNAFYEITGLDAYDEPDKESAEIVQNTDYDKYLAGVKNMVHENVKVDLPSKLSGYDSIKIVNDNQTVGEVGIMDRGIQGSNHYIAIDKIFIEKDFRGKGFANDAMRILFEYADKNNIIITLTPDNVWGASVSKLKAWYKSLGFVENKGRKKDFQTMQLMYRLPKGIRLNEENFKGKAYRVDSGFSNKSKTAGDVVRFERDELGNVGDFTHITDEKLKELDNHPAIDIIWVTKTFEDAKRYSNTDDFSDIEEFDINGDVIAEDGDGGYLILIKSAETLNEIYDEIGILKKVLRGKRNVDFIKLNKNNIGKVERNNIGVIPVRINANNEIMSIIYNNNGKDDAHKLYEIVKKNGGFLTDKTPEEAREIGRILGHSDKVIDEYIRRKYTDKTLNEQSIKDFEKQIEKDVKTHKLNKFLLYKNDDYKVYAVNGDAVRKNGFDEWVDGGHHYVDLDEPKKDQKYAKFIPEDEIWVDDVFIIKPDDLGAILLHETLERHLMKYFGEEYSNGKNGAHEIANKAEVEYRKTSKTNDIDYKTSDEIYNKFVTEYAKHHREKKVELNESVMNEAQLMSLQDLPFKQEVEQLGGKIYSVGGAVRDEFLGKESKDLDLLITGIPMEELEQILSKYGRVDAVGKSFGILKFKPEGATEQIDIAIPRTEKPSGEGGHKGFEVTSDHTLPIEKELKRRDFTINAIAKDTEGNIVDPYGGQEDLKNKIIRVVNPEAFSDDPLRMLRAVQFASRFGFTIEPETMKLIQDNASRIKEIPPERILTEFDKIVKNNK